MHHTTKRFKYHAPVKLGAQTENTRILRDDSPIYGHLSMMPKITIGKVSSLTRKWITERMLHRKFRFPGK